MSARNQVMVMLIAWMALCAPTSSAQTSTPEEPQVDETTTGDEGGAEAQERSREERKQQRIEEYLRKREERRAHKDLNRQHRELRQVEAEAAKIESKQLAAAAAAAEAVPLEEPLTELTPAPTAKKRSKGRRASSLPRDLARAQQNVRVTGLAQDPTVQDYLVMIDKQLASPHQLAAFGSFLAQNGMVREALAYYDVALRIDRSDPLLWINAGTLQLKSANLSAAATHFSRALKLDPNSAMAHYNLGSTLHAMDKYEDAIWEYKIALSIDPSLGDPAHNPSAAHNDLLTAVKLLLYQEQAGSLSLPLLDVETGRMLTAGAENR